MTTLADLIVGNGMASLPTDWGSRLLQKSTGSKQKLGAISKMGDRTLGLLIIGSSAVVLHSSNVVRSRVIAREDAGPQAPPVGERRARQQDSTHPENIELAHY